MRKIGNSLEYIFCNYLNTKRVRPKNNYTKQRVKQLQKDYYSSNPIQNDIMIKNSSLESIFNDLNVELKYGRNGSSFILNNDNTGKIGDSSDIVIQTNETVYKFSLKHNNESIKHQRPNSLWRQLVLNNSDKIKYIRDYTEINKKWIKKWVTNKYKLFNEIPIKEKELMYSEINNLVMQWIQTVDKKNQIAFIKFLLGHDDCYILKWCPKDTKFFCINKNFRTRLNIQRVWKQNNSIYIKVNTHIIQMRLHNASSRLFGSKLFSLKYDTKFVKNVQSKSI